jgi:transposase
VSKLLLFWAPLAGNVIVDTTEARRLQSGAVQSTSAISALVASVADPEAFRSGRDFSTWIGLVPKQNSSGGKEKLGSITKRGDRYLRSLFTAGALAVIRYAKIHGINHRPWLTALLARRPTKVAAVSRTLSNWWCKYSGTRTLAKDESLGARLIVVRLA